MTRVLLAGLASEHRRALLAEATRLDVAAMHCEFDEAEQAVRLDAIDAVVLDPSTHDGWRAAKLLRGAHRGLILFGLALGGSVDLQVVWLSVLDACAPIGSNPRLVLASLRAIERSRAGFGGARIRVGRVEVDTAERRVWVDGVDLGLTPLEARAMELLALRRGRPVTAEHLANQLSPQPIGDVTNYAAVLFHHIRRKLRRAGLPDGVIACRRYVGYALDGALAA